MKIITTQQLRPKQYSQINALWDQEYPKNLNGRFPLLLNDVEQVYHYLVEDENYNIIAWAAYFAKEKQVRFSIIVSENYKHKGIGKQLINVLKTRGITMYGWVIDRPISSKIMASLIFLRSVFTKNLDLKY